MSAERIVISILALAASAFGQASIVPEQVSMGAPLGSTSRVTQTIWLTSAGQALDFNLSVRYLSPTTGWLSATPLHGTSPAQVTISADPTNLAQGTYSAQVVASVGPLHLGAWTTVTFTIAPAGTNAGGLSVTPSSLIFVGPGTPDPQNLTVSNAQGTSGTVAFSATANSSGWLQVSGSNLTTPGTVAVQAYAAGLKAGSYAGTVTITASGTQKSTVVPVTLVVPASGIGDIPTISPAQQKLIFNYESGTPTSTDSPNPPIQSVLVQSDSTKLIQVTATSNVSWLGVAAAYWMNFTTTAITSAPGLLYVKVDATGLSAASSPYSGTVTLSSPGLASVDIPVTLTVTTGGRTVLNSNPSFTSLDAELDILTSNLSLTASRNTYVIATVSPGTPWLKISPEFGLITTSNAVDFTVTADVTGLPSGTYNGWINFAGSGGDPSIRIPVQMKTLGPTVSQGLTISPTALSFAAMTGDPDPFQFLNVFSAISANQDFTISSNSDWLTVTPLSGTTPSWPKVTASAAVPAGSYTGIISITSLLTHDEVKIPVAYKLAQRSLATTPATLTFTQQSVGAAIPTQEVQVTANAPSTFTVASQPSWIKIQPATNLSTPIKLVISVDPKGMAPGSYQDTVVLSGPNESRIGVSLTLAEPAPPTVTPDTISFSYELGAPAPQPQTLLVASPNGVAKFTASASTQSGVKWLQASPASGSTPGSVSVSVDTRQLVPGKHSGTVSVQVQDVVAKTFTVAVSLTVSGSSVQVREVLNAATLAPASIAPGEIVTITGIGLGPAVPVVGKASSAGAFGTQLAGVTVSFDSIPAPLLFVQEGQVNAIAPYALAGRTSSRLQIQSDAGYSIPIDVKVVDAAPGIFVSSTNGRGQAAALNADSTPNSVLNPAPRGTVVVLYLTGEGQTDPPGQDGRVIMTDVRRPLLPVTAAIGGHPADVLYAGSAPTLVSGMCQVNVKIPENLDPGTQTVEVQVGGIPSQRGVTIEVR